MKKAALILSAAICVVTISARAADWTDADGNTYTALKYIKGNGDGKGYLVTDIVPNCTDIVMMKFKPVSASSALFCARDQNAKNQFACYHSYSSSKNYIRIDRDTSQQTSTSTVSTSSDYLFVADYGRKTATIEQSGLNTDLFGKALGGNDTYYVGSRLVFFAMHKNCSGYGNYGRDYIYYFELYDSSGNLTHCLLPAMRDSERDSDRVYGFYDTRTGTFYQQSGGAFIVAERTVKVTDTCKKWTGRGANNKMSTPENWENNDMPAAGDDLDFTLAAPLAKINADMGDVTFGKVWIDDGDLPGFTNKLTATAINDLEGMRKYEATADFTFTLKAPSGQDFRWDGGVAANWSSTDASWLCNSASSVWYDHNNAIFDTADATATLTINAAPDELKFSQSATIVGSSTLTVPTVSVVPDVAATISAPTAGALEKTGAGTLTLASSRDDQTTLSEGTLAMSGGETTLDWSKFTFGTDTTKSVVLHFKNGATLKEIPNSWYVGNVSGVTSTLVKEGGDWNATQDLIIGRASGATTTFIHKGGTLSVARYFYLGRYASINPTTLEISGGTVSSTKTGDNMIIGVASDARVVVTNGGTFSVAGTLRFGGDSNTSGNGTLDIASGTVTVMNGLLFGNQSSWSGTGTVNLGKDGMLELGQVRFVDGSGTGNTFNFNGGTLKARSATTEFIKVSDKLMVNVSENGGTIDNNGVNISIQENFSGPGTINLIGSGTTTFAAGVGAEGGVSVANGTTLALDVTEQSSLGSLTLAAGSKLALSGVTQSSLGAVTLEAGSTIDIATPATDVAAFAATALNLPEEGTVALTSDGGAFVEGLYAICKMSGVSAADGVKFAPVTGDLVARWSVVDGDTLMLTVGAVDPNTWTGGANNGNLSDPDNWHGRAVPTSGTVTINTSGTLTVGNTFRPDVIVFPETCGAVTIAGENAITGLSAVTNLSSSTCTFEVPVAFAGEICVSQGAYYYYNNSNNQPTLSDGGKVRFAGGVTGTSFAEGTSRWLDGEFTLTDIENCAQASSDELWTLKGGSSLTITGSSAEQLAITDLSWLNNDGGAFTTAVIRTSALVCLRNEGEFVVTEELVMTLPGTDRHISQRGSQGKYKFEKVTLGDNGTAGVFYVANRGNWYTENKHVYIGAGGLCFAEGAKPNTAYAFGRRDNDNVHIYPWHSDYTIAAKGGTTRDVIVYKPTYFHTVDENGVPRTLTLNGVADVRDTLTVKGSGRFQVNSDGMGSGKITVTDSVTLAYASKADLGTGAVTVGANATMEVASGAHTFEGGLTLNDGATLAFNFTKRTVTPQIAVAEGKTLTAKGAVKVKIPVQSKWPTGGEKILTTCGGFDAEGVTVSLAEGAPKWAKRVYVNEDGNIVLDVKPRGTRVIVR